MKKEKDQEKDIAFVYIGQKPSPDVLAAAEKEGRAEVAAFLSAGRPSEPWAQQLFDVLKDAKTIKLTVLPLDRSDKTKFFADHMRDLGLFLPKSRENFLKDGLSQLNDLDETTDNKQTLRFCASIMDARNKAGGSLGPEHDERLAEIMQDNKIVGKTMRWIEKTLEAKSGIRTAVVYDERDRTQDRAARE